MTEPTVIQVKAVNPRPPAAPRAAKPVVHVRSVGALATNVAAATGEAVFAVGGGVALAAVAAGVVGVPMVAAAARGRLQRSAASTRSRSTKTSTPSTGRPGAAKTRGASSNGGTGSGGGRLRGLLGKPGPTAGPTGRRQAAGSATRGPGGVSTGAGRSVRNGKPSAVGRLAKKIRQAQDRQAAKPMSQRKAAKQAIKALGVKPAPGPIRRTGGWLRRKVRRTPPMPVGTTPPATAGKGKKPQTVASTVKGSKAAKAVTGTPAPAPNPAPTAPGTPIKPTAQPVAAAGGTMSVGPASSAMRALLDVVENDMRRIANAYDPEGIEEVLAEYEKWPEVLDALGGVWRIMVTKAEDDYPLPPAAYAVIDEIRAHQNNVARAAEAVPGLVRAIIRQHLDDMADRRNAMYDHRANPNTAAK